tara:strand:+ start:94 stop:1380 length:1287 start_codon:yes stop_codon:yes gene_type:complete
MTDTVIEIEHLYKEYRLGLIGYGTLREDLQSWWAWFRGKEDPNSMLFSGDHSGNGKTSDHILALNDINLIVERGERLGIIGKNGAGKTTLLKILARIASPTKGTAKIKGRIASLIAVGTGFHPELTGRENIYLNGSILGLRKFEIDQCFDEIIDFSGVEQFIETPIKRYSSGMTIRLGFAVAAHLDPDVLIVDEVLAVGDAEFRKKAIGKMKDVSEGEGRTVLFVSHNMQSIQELCPNSILLDQGSILKKGESSEVVGEYLGGTGLPSGEDLMHVIELNQIKDVDGSVKFTDFKILNNYSKECFNYKRGEHVFFHIHYKVFQPVENLIHALVISSGRSGEMLTALNHIVSDSPLPSNYEGKIVLDLNTESLNEGEFPLAFCLLRKGIQKDCDYIPSSVIPVLSIRNEKENKICKGIISMKAKFDHYKL